MAKEQRQFEMHSSILYDVILNQAGSLQKAILEGVMNSVDAGAKECKIEINQSYVGLVDNGRGFRSRKQVEEWFEVFGQPHAEEEQKRYGRFRMGRGQMFAYGVNLWRTGKFEMSVDVKHKGLKYELSTHKESVDGCRVGIDLYSHLSLYEMQRVVEELHLWLKFVPINVYVNDKLVSVGLTDGREWDHDDENAQYLLAGRSDLLIYNQGIFVRSYGGYVFGTGGFIVTRKPVNVNFARNDIQSSCPVWQAISSRLRKMMGHKIERKPTLSKDERTMLLQSMFSGDVSRHVGVAAKVITAVTGRHYTLRDLADARCVTSAEDGDNVADRVMRSKRAFVIAKSVLDTCNCSSAEEFVTKLLSNCNHVFNREEFAKIRYVTMAELIDNLSTDYTIIPPEQYTPNERIWLRLCDVADAYATQEDRKRRLIRLGLHVGANGWTDGVSYIALCRNYLKEHDFTLQGIHGVARLMHHEYCHVTSSQQRHDHDQEFYEKFHDDIAYVGRFVEYAVTRLPQIFEAAKRKIGRRALAAASDTDRASRLAVSQANTD